MPKRSAGMFLRMAWRRYGRLGSRRLAMPPNRHDCEVFHAVFEADVDGDNVRIITAYRPVL